MVIGSTTATPTKDDTTVTEMITAPMFVDGVTMLPLRDTANFAGGSVKYVDNGYVLIFPNEVND